MTRRKNSPIMDVLKGLIITIIFSYSIFSQPFTNEEKKILEMQDKRNINTKFEWVNLANKGGEELSNRIFLALQNSNDSAAFEVLKNIINDSVIVDKFFYILSLSYFNNEQNKSYLLNRLKSEKNDDAEFALLYALSSIGDEAVLKEINSINPTGENIDEGIMFALKNFSIRKIGSAALFERIFQAICNDTSKNEYVSDFTYSLNRLGDKSIISQYKDYLNMATLSYIPKNRMWSISAIGKLQDTSNIPLLLDVLKNEKDWRVRVNTINAIGNHTIDLNSPQLDEAVASLLNHAVNDENAHVSITAWQVLGKMFAGADTRNPLTRKIQQEIQFIMPSNKAIDWQIKAEAIRTYAKIFRDEAKNDLLAKFSETDNYDIKAAVIGAFAFMDNAMVYKELRDSISADVMRYNAKNPNKDGSMIGSNDLAKVYKAFVDALAALDDKLDAENRNIIRLMFSEFSASRHAAITDVCLTNLQDSMYLQYRGETCQIMIFDYEGFKYPKDKDVMIMFIQAWDAMKYDGVKDLLIKNLKHEDYDIAKATADALKNITGNDYENQITAPKYRHDFDWNFIDKLGEKKIATIKTNQGIIIIELYPNIAPFTVQNFVKLGEKGYYNNTVFHRVIPNFVIQGGDPTGTGYDGPGYSIRSEFSPLSFEEYSVGMASSGKDTEGSQFFITHSPQPHLDGKYTLFGRVIEGFDVVDRIQIGDYIETISFSAQ